MWRAAIAAVRQLREREPEVASAPPAGNEGSTQDTQNKPQTRCQQVPMATPWHVRRSGHHAADCAEAAPSRWQRRRGSWMYVIARAVGSGHLNIRNTWPRTPLFHTVVIASELI